MTQVISSPDDISAKQIVSDGIQTARPNDTSPFQLVYLDFDGELTRYRNRDLGLDFAVTVDDPGFSDEEKQHILSMLASRYADSGIFFTLDRPEGRMEDYSTLFFGKSDSFRDYGLFLGLAETIDAGNRIWNDNAFVLLDNTLPLEQVISVADHELGHILNGDVHETVTGTLDDYALTTFKESENNNSFQRANAIGTVNDAYQITGKSYDGIIDYDYFSFTAGLSGTLQLTKNKSPYLYSISLFDSSGNLIKSDNHKSSPSLTYTVTQGSLYYFCVRPTEDSTSTRSYTVALSITNGYTPNPDPTPTPTDSYLPDLKVTWVDTFKDGISCHEFDNNDTIHVQMYICNESSTGASAACRASLTLGNVTKYFTVPALNPRAGRAFGFTITVPELGQRGSLNLLGYVDCDYVVQESNEYNNSTAGDSDVYIGDRTPPAKPVAQADITTPTQGVVTVTAVFSEDSVKKEYSLDNKTWKTYTAGILFSSKGIVYFRGTDAAGNVSDVTSYTVSNIVERVVSQTMRVNDNVISGIDIVSGGRVYVESQGRISNAAVFSGGTMYVSGGGTAIGIMENGGYVDVEAGAKVTFSPNAFSGVTINDSATVHAGTVANNTTVNSRGHLDVYSGGIANNATLNYSGHLDVYSGGIANNTTVNSYGWFYVSSGGIANNTTVNSGGRQIISSGGIANNVTVNSNAYLHLLGLVNSTSVNSGGCILVYSGGIACNTILNKGNMYVSSGCSAINTFINSGCRLRVLSDGTATGILLIASGGSVDVSSGGGIDFNIAGIKDGSAAIVSNLSCIYGTPTFTLTVSGHQSNGTYVLADGASGFNQTISIQSPVARFAQRAGYSPGMLSVGRTVTIGGAGYTLNLNDDKLTLTVSGSSPAQGDRDGDGKSDVMFVWTGNNYAHGYWMNGKSDWWSANVGGISPDWDNLGSYDMNGDDRADAVMVGNVVVNGNKGAYIGYYQNGNDMDGWVDIGYLNNEEGIAWKNKVGNLTGNASKNTIVWYAPELFALGAWTDGTADWVTLSNSFGGEAWKLVGCGDFDGSRKDSVLMSYNGGQLFYSVGFGDAAPQSLGSADWRGWEIRAIGDFSGDRKDDLVLFHKGTGSMVMCADGNVDSYKSIGQLAADDWFIVGAGDYNGDAMDDLLVRQYSTGMLGYYSAGNTANWVELGRGVGMEWTVIA